MRYLVLDTETIGLAPVAEAGSVCEISVREVREDFSEVAHYYSKLDPEALISAGATATHGIYNEDVEFEPTMAEWLDQVLDHNIWGRTEEPFYFIAHNARFDQKFLAPYIECPYEVVDSLRLARRYYPKAESHKLQTLRVELRLPHDLTDAHSAGGDTKTLVNFLQRMSDDTGLTLPELCVDAQHSDPITTFGFGKHKGKTLVDVKTKWPSYITWLLEQPTLDPELREALLRL